MAGLRPTTAPPLKQATPEDGPSALDLGRQDRLTPDEGPNENTAMAGPPSPARLPIRRSASESARMNRGVHYGVGSSSAGMKVLHGPWKTIWPGMLFCSLIGFTGAKGADLLARFSRSENMGRVY